MSLVSFQKILSKFVGETNQYTMQTVLSKTGIEVSYPCTVHLLVNGENFECEYKSDHTGRDLLHYVCGIQHIRNCSFWGLKFMDTKCMDEQRYWLDLDKLIKPQVQNVSPIRFYFRMKVYPPEPYKLVDPFLKHPIYQQLRLDLLGGRLFCDINDTGMLVALILQHVHGNFHPSLVGVYITYIRTKILRKERCTKQFYSDAQKRALEIYQTLLGGLTQSELEDMFLRLASKLESYGVEPFLLRNIDKRELLLWMNHCGMRTFDRNKKTAHIGWNSIAKITHEGKCLFIHLAVGGVIVLECVNYSECDYIWSIAVEHLVYFTSAQYVSVGLEASLHDNVSDISSFFDSCVSSYNQFNSDVLEEELQISCSLLKLIDFNSWRSQLSVIYAVVILYVMGSHTSIFDEMPLVYSIRNYIKDVLSAFVFNRMITS